MGGQLSSPETERRTISNSVGGNEGACASSVPDESFAGGLVSQTDGLKMYQKLRSFKEIASLSYDEFVQCIQELNSLSGKLVDTNGKQLVFAVKQGSDATMLWKATVRVACVKIDAETKDIEAVRLLPLLTFLQVFKTLMCQLQLQESVPDGKLKEVGPFTASMLLDNISVSSQYQSSQEECCICLERMPNVTLPCTHSYCLPCIEQWNVFNKTCPICHENLSSTGDTWELSEAPDESEVQQEIQKALEGLVNESSFRKKVP